MNKKFEDYVYELTNSLTETAMAIRKVSGMSEEYIKAETYKHINKKINEFIANLTNPNKIYFQDFSCFNIPLLPATSLN